MSVAINIDLRPNRSAKGPQNDGAIPCARRYVVMVRLTVLYGMSRPLHYVSTSNERVSLASLPTSEISVIAGKYMFEDNPDKEAVAETIKTRASLV